MLRRSLRKFGQGTPVKLDNFAKYLIIGAGDAGNSMAKLIRSRGLVSNHHEVKLIDEKTTYYYQSGQTKVAAGINDLDEIRISNRWVLPFRTVVIDSLAAKVVPEENYVELKDGKKVGYSNLIIASGIQVNLDSVKGLKEALEDPEVPVGSIYVPKYAAKFSFLRENFKGGNALFCQPGTAIKCQGATQKVMYTSSQGWKGKGAKVQFFAGGERFLSPDYFNQELAKVAKSYNIETNFKHNLVEVRGKERIAVFSTPQGLKEVKFDILQASPSQSPAPFIAQSGLAGPLGFVDVDMYTLRHKKFNNIWAVGDCAELPTSKTLSAVNTQVHVLADQLAKAANKPHSDLLYNGYTACPVLVSKRKVLLCEFGYNGELMPTFLQTAKPSYLSGILYLTLFRWTSLLGLNHHLYPIACFIRKFTKYLGTAPDKVKK